MTEVNICLCPTEMEMNGDMYDKDRLFLAIRMFVRGRLGVRTPVEVWMGPQGVKSADVFDGSSDLISCREAGESLMEDFWRATNDGSDADLFVQPAD